MLNTADSSAGDRKFFSIAMPTALTLMLIALWTISRRYAGLHGDAELYALQALARIHPNLATDLYLQNVSQDRFTIFSPLYAWCIGWFGLHPAAAVLTVCFAAWFFTASWFLARELLGRDSAYLAVGGLIILDGSYGASNVFHYAENWLTARSLGEALAVTALACHFRGARGLAIVIAIVACFVHPLMVLPCLMLLICLRFPVRRSAIAALILVVGALLVAFGALALHSSQGPLAVIDGTWLEVVCERSQFLLLKYWRVLDWEVNLRPFVCLALAAIVNGQGPIRDLCVAAAIVAAAGIAVSFISSAVGPIAILLQGQAWRWDWIGCFLGALLLAPTALKVSSDEKCGPLCAVLLVFGWTFSAVDSLACVSLALILWLVRGHITDRIAKLLRWAAALLGVIAFVWVAANIGTILSSPAGESGLEIAAISRLRNIMGLSVSAAAVLWLLFSWIRAQRSRTPLLLTSLALAVFSALILPGSMSDIMRDGTPAMIHEFADWRGAIPPSASVYVVPASNSARFAWFTLNRPSYLSVDQSAGVIFSRATADEVVRRSQVLLPMVEPTWRLRSHGMKMRSDPKIGSTPKPMTKERLVSICSDPLMDFVVAKENVGFDARPHTHVGDWYLWNLYDCRHVRSLAPSA